MKKLLLLLGLIGLLALALIIQQSHFQANEPPAASPVDASGTRDVVFIGDSIMSGYGLESGEGWPDMLADESSLRVENLGCAGAGFASVGTCGMDYSGLVDVAARLQPKIVVIQSTDNDFWFDAETVNQSTTKTIEKLRKLLPETKIVGLSTIMWNNEPWSKEIAFTSDVLEKAVTENAGEFVQLGQPISGNPEFIQDDQEHPTLAGQLALAGEVKKALDGLSISL